MKRIEASSPHFRGGFKSHTLGILIVSSAAICNKAAYNTSTHGDTVNIAGLFFNLESKCLETG
jgi:hypothetical protein